MAQCERSGERAACGKEPGQEQASGKDRIHGVTHYTRLPFFFSSQSEHEVPLV